MDEADQRHLVQPVSELRDNLAEPEQEEISILEHIAEMDHRKILVLLFSAQHHSSLRDSGAVHRT